jgi:hypothetical protein
VIPQILTNGALSRVPLRKRGTSPLGLPITEAFDCESSKIFPLSQVFQFTEFTSRLQSLRRQPRFITRVVTMGARTKNKRVEKRGSRKKKDSISVSAQPEATKKKAKRKPKLIALKGREQSQSQLKPTFEQIQLRAYFISEQRRNQGIAGDEHSDWVRAERELWNELLAERVSARD